MYGDPDVLRSRVDDLREQAADVRALADHLVAQTEQIGRQGWSGRAAEAMRLRVGERAAHLRAAAGQHDTAADCLEDHANDVTELLETIAARERRFADVVAEATERVARREAGAPTDAGAEADVALLALEPPPPGHRDWLELEVPGL
jgi:uncharacterized protein YukE